MLGDIRKIVEAFSVRVPVLKVSPPQMAIGNGPVASAQVETVQTFTMKRFRKLVF